MKLKKKSKNGKPAHGVMICDVVPRKNSKHDMLIFFLGTTSHIMTPCAGFPIF
jgi:hypothetical protein